MAQNKPSHEAPREVVGKSWQRHGLREDGSVDLHAYTFCDYAHFGSVDHRGALVFLDTKSGADKWMGCSPQTIATLGSVASP